MMDVLTGIVENITFQGQNEYVVFRLKTDKGMVVVTGNTGAPLPGEDVEVSGNWMTHPKYGKQFRGEVMRRIQPATLPAIERFLASGAVKGIGPAMAQRMVARFGLKTLDILEREPRHLLEIEGIGAKKLAMIVESFSAKTELRELMFFLESRGIPGAFARRIHAVYGEGAVQVIEQDPYRLAEEVDGIGFRTADRIALACGVQSADFARIAAGIRYALLGTADAGHTCVPEDVLVQAAAKELACDSYNVAEVLSQLLRQGTLAMEDAWGQTLIYPDHLYHAERKVAERLLFLRDHAKKLREADVTALTAKFEQERRIELAEAQRDAVRAATNHGVLVMTGGPGTGKTTTVQAVLNVLSLQGCKIVLAAPTGRAAKRLSEATGREALTVHRLLEATGSRAGRSMFGRGEDNPIDADVVIVDEVSMMDILLMYYLLRAVPNGCRVVLVGDVDQLPAVGPGSVLKDIIRSETTPVVRLTEIFRQAGQSQIVVNAHRINRGQFPDVRSTRDFQLREVADDAAAAELVVRICCDELPREGVDVGRDVQVLSPMHRLACGVENLNKLLQASLNPPSRGKPEVAHAGRIFRIGDKVMQTRNDYDKGVFNGDIGRVADMDDEMVLIRYPEGDVPYDRSELDALAPAYAMSVHKSQGSEYPVVVLTLVSGHYVMLQRNLLYTAITRAKQRVILVGSSAALGTAVANDRTRRRHSLLAERLRREAFE